MREVAVKQTQIALEKAPIAGAVAELHLKVGETPALEQRRVGQYGSTVDASLKKAPSFR